MSALLYIEIMMIRLICCVAALAVAPTFTLAAESFDSWREGFVRKAAAEGIPEATTRTALAGVAPNPRIVELDRAQPEFFKGPGAYVDMMVSDARTQRGLESLRQHDQLLAGLERETGVAGTIPVAIWGVETAFGQIMGGFDVIEALATLAHDGRRRTFAEQELVAALRLLGRGQPRNTFKGSWAGAFGHTQFMPSSALRLARDGDGDGRADLYTVPDALASAAHYMEQAGWQRGAPWGAEVRLPLGFALPHPDTALSLRQWLERGVARADGQAWSNRWLDQRGKLLLPTGITGPAFLTFANFEVIKKYNASTSYALSVALLSDRLGGAGGLRASWPTVVLNRTDVIALQQALQAQGFDVGVPDGQMGPKTRAALAAFQLKAGLPADGFPGAPTLARLLPQATPVSSPAVAVTPPVTPPVAQEVLPPEKPKRKQRRYGWHH